MTTLGKDGECYGLTVNSFSSVSLDPPLILWSIDRRSSCFAAFTECHRFAVNVLAADQRAISDHFTRYEAAKFTQKPFHDGIGKIPLLDDAAAVFECTTWAHHDGGDHVIILGRIERFAWQSCRVLAFSEGRYGIVMLHPDDESRHHHCADGEDHHPFDDFLMSLLIRTYDKASADFSGVLDIAAMTRAQMRILSIAAMDGARARTELQTRALLSESALEEALERLQKRGYIVPAGEDFVITKAGRSQLAALIADAHDCEAETAANLSSRELVQLKSLLRRLIMREASSG